MNGLDYSSLNGSKGWVRDATLYGYADQREQTSKALWNCPCHHQAVQMDQDAAILLMDQT